MRLVGWPDSGWLHDGLPGRLSDSQIAGKRPSGEDRRACRANPLGHPAGARAGCSFCDPRTSYGRTIGRTIVLLNRARVGRIFEEHRSTRWQFHLSGAPPLHLNRPDTFVFRLPTQSAVVQMVVQWRTEGFRTSTPNVVCSIFKNVFQQTSSIDTEDRSSVSRCGPKTPSKQTD